MSILIRKHHGETGLSGIGKLGIIGFVSAMASALVTTIWAVYLNGFLGNSAYVGLISTFLSLIAVASYFIFIPIIEKSSKSKLYISSLAIFGISYILFSITKNFYLFLLIAIITNIVYAVRITSFGLMVKDKSPKNILSRNEGLMYTFGNLAWVIGPLIAGYIVSSSGTSTLFIISSIFVFLALGIVILTKTKDDEKLKKADSNIFINVKEFFKDKHRVIAYIIGSGPSFWWSLIYLFIPLYIINNNLPELWIGYFLFAIPLPLMTLEYKFSRLAEKKGFKLFFKLGFLLAAVASLICFFISSPYIVLSILVLASIGLAMLEPTTETYFFKATNKKTEERFYGPFNTRIEIGGLLGKFIPSLLILILPFNSVFLIFGIAMLVFFLISFKAK